MLRQGIQDTTVIDDSGGYIVESRRKFGPPGVWWHCLLTSLPNDKENVSHRGLTIEPVEISTIVPELLFEVSQCFIKRRLRNISGVARAQS